MTGTPTGSTGGGGVEGPPVDAWMDELSNWGRWGADDEQGTLNLIDEAATRRAAQCVEHGRVVSCAEEIRSNGTQTQRLMVGTGLSRDPSDEGSDRPGLSDDGHGSVAAEYLGVIYHGLRITHIDAPSHVFWDGKMYNGASSSLVTDWQGATRNDVRAAGGGIVTRGILVDAPALFDKERLEPGEAIYPGHLEEALDRAGVEPHPGDALLVRTGEAIRRQQEGRAYEGTGQPGLHGSCLPWLRRYDIALLGSDSAQDVRPSGIPQFAIPIHSVGLVAMGLWLADNCNLESLAATCKELGRSTFSLTIAPLKFRGATGSPVNPLAIF